MKERTNNKTPQQRQLKFSELLEKILDMRASNPAAVSHIVDLRKYIRSNQKKTKKLFLEVHSDIEYAREQQYHCILEQHQGTNSFLQDVRLDLGEVKEHQSNVRSDIEEVKEQQRQMIARQADINEEVKEQ